MKKDKSISELIVEYFKSHPNEDIPHGPVVDWVEEFYIKLYNKKPRDTWRAIRKLHEEGFLIKVKKEYTGTTLTLYEKENWKISHQCKKRRFWKEMVINV